ncbi:hypothetical protein GR702_06310 [Novosphingobium sp. FGD1]|jgi:hypothetical protein|uniref:DUF98 domain-containing protein n=2 Tax=Novosphingobium silvae TaxID=2692619 RepID=A0A7X4GFD4_9SPHN|nr:hypothetical protein [Novosphingobium silvae]MYL97385.1 hypothetical protein [Novosphingobium silvae]
MASPAVPAPAPVPTLAQFEAVLRRHDSATLALEEWCALRQIARPAAVTARVLAPAEAPTRLPTAPGPHHDPARKLELKDGEAVTLRNVSLSCGGTVLSVAWNWYVPARLSREMNEALRSSQAPFGKVVAPLGFRRRPLSIVAGPARGCPADTISTHEAMLVLPDGTPLAYLVECYTAANLEPLPR